jgi:hypothetical protein
MSLCCICFLCIQWLFHSVAFVFMLIYVHSRRLAFVCIRPRAMHSETVALLQLCIHRTFTRIQWLCIWDLHYNLDCILDSRNYDTLSCILSRLHSRHVTYRCILSHARRAAFMCFVAFTFACIRMHSCTLQRILLHSTRTLLNVRACTWMHLKASQMHRESIQASSASCYLQLGSSFFERGPRRPWL